MIESGSCGSGLISRKSECDAGATALDLSNKRAGRDPLPGSPGGYEPPGCVFHVSGYLEVMGRFNDASCSSTYKCICKSYSPDSYSYDPFGALGYGGGSHILLCGGLPC